jgi:hypothetical protein
VGKFPTSLNAVLGKGDEMRTDDLKAALTRRVGMTCAVVFFALAFAAPASAQSTYTLTVNLAGIGTIVSEPAGIECNVLVPTCSASFPAGTAVTLTVSTAVNTTFAGWSGACSGQQTCTLVMNGPQTATATIGLTPVCMISGQGGWWWNSAEGGRGYFIDNNNAGRLYFVMMGYDVSGHATWYAALASQAASTCTYTGTLASFGGGQTLTGAFQAPTSATNIGNFSLTFTDATHANVQLPGETLALQRFMYTAAGSSTFPASIAAQLTGIYWNPEEPGRGFAIEIQNGVLYIGGYMYDASGLPVWYVVAPTAPYSPLQASQPRQRCCTGIILGPPPPFDSPFLGDWAQFSNGQVLGGPYRAPVVFSGDVGAMSLMFQGGQTPNAVLGLPNGNSTILQRFTY